MVVDAVTPFRERMAELLADPAELDRILARGAERAAVIARGDDGPGPRRGRAAARGGVGSLPMPHHGVAVTVPEPWSTTLQQAREDFGDPMASAIPPHVTLLPPTAIPPDDMDGVPRAPARGHGGRRAVRHGALGHRHVPARSRRWCSCRSRAASRTARRWSGRCARGRSSRSLDFPYHPHVTVAHHLDEPALDRAFESLADFRCAFRVASVELYHHDDDGVWRVIDSFALGG